MQTITYLFESSRIRALFFITLLLSSCEIEKRHYTSGYSIKWNSKIENNSSINDSQILLRKERIVNFSNQLKEESENLNTKNCRITVSYNQLQTKQERINELKSIVQFNNLPKGQIPSKLINTPQFSNVKTRHLDKLNSEIKLSKLAVLSLTLAIIGIFALFSTYSIFVALIVEILASIAGYFARIKINNHPDTYRGLKIASIGFICGIICSILILTFLLLFLFTYIYSSI